MIKYEDLRTGSTFNVLFYGIKPVNDDKELSYNYLLKAFQNSNKKSVMFIKDGNNSCHESVTKTVFTLDGNKMVNKEIGLYFFANYVDNDRTQYMDSKIICEYFRDAALSCKKGKSLEMKKNI